MPFRRLVPIISTVLALTACTRYGLPGAGSPPTATGSPSASPAVAATPVPSPSSPTVPPPSPGASSSASPPGTENLNLSPEERRVARALADAVRAFNDRVLENGRWWSTLSTSSDLSALARPVAGVGSYEQTPSQATAEDGSVTRHLTTRAATKVDTVIESLQRTDTPSGSLVKAALTRTTTVSGLGLAPSRSDESQTLTGGRFGPSGTMSVTHRGADDIVDWELMASTGPGAVDAPVGSGDVRIDLGGSSRRFALTWDSQATPQLTLRDTGGLLEATTSAGSDGRFTTVVFRWGHEQRGEIHLP